MVAAMSVEDRRGREWRDPVADRVLGASPELEPKAQASDLVDLSEPAHAEIIKALFQMESLGFDLRDSAIVLQAIRAGRRTHADAVHGDYLRLRIREQARERRTHPAVVYYMRVGNRVKIGFSTNLTERVSALAPEEVMATEPGDRSVEEARHRQFADLRVAREWFRLEEPLTSHVTALGWAAA